MHTLSRIVLILFILPALVACDKELDIRPRQSIDSDLVFTSPANLEAALYGAYSEIKGTFNGPFGGELCGGDFNLISEMLAADGNVVWGGTFDTYDEVFVKEILTTNAMVTNNWIRAYNAINNVNAVLANLDVADDDPALRDRIEGEARTIRGLLYFELVRLWARPWGTGSEASDPGVPLVLQPVLTEADAAATAQLGRSTVANVYQQVIDDLTRAEELLKGNGRNGANLSTYAAAALLSRVYLQRGEYANAAAAANRVIESGAYGLNPTPLDAFNNTANTAEDVFAIQQTALSNAGTSNGGLATFYARLNGAGRGDVQVQPAHLDLYEAGDLRGGLQDDLPETATITNINDMYYVGVGGQNAGFIQSAKYGDPVLNIPVIRLAELYLTRAEANFEAGAGVGAAPLEDINTIRRRAGLADLTSVDRAAIRRERERELAFEGFRIHDKKRWKANVGNLPWDSPQLVLPIPEREIEVYDIEQNEGY